MRGLVVGFGMLTTQLTLGALPWPAKVVTLVGGSEDPRPIGPPVRSSSMVPPGAPFPLFQWYVAAAIRQYGLPLVEKEGAVPPLLTPAGLQLSNSLNWAMAQVYPSAPDFDAVALFFEVDEVDEVPGLDRLLELGTLFEPGTLFEAGKAVLGEGEPLKPPRRATAPIAAAATTAKAASPATRRDLREVDRAGRSSS